MEIEKELKTSFRNDKQKATLNILFTANWLQQFHNKEFRPKKLSVQQYNILRILRGQRGNPMTISMIKERMLERESDVSRVVEKMRKNGLLQRCTDPKDRRAALCPITEKGLSVLSELDEVENYFDCLMDGINDSEIGELNRILDKLRSAQFTPS